MWWWQTIAEVLQRVKSLSTTLSTIIRLLVEIDSRVIQANQSLKRIETLLRQPGQLNLVITGDDPMLKFKIVLPPASAPDVVKGELSVSIDGAEPFVIDTGAGGEVVDDRLAGSDNDAVHAELVYVDDAGNKSAPSILDVVLTDTIAPGQPDALSLVVTSEE